MSDAKVYRPRAWPAALHLALLAVVIALPLLVLLGVLIDRSATQEHERLERLIGQELDELVAAVDRDIERRIAILQTLATSPALRQEDWRAFHDQAKTSLGRNYLVLVDSDGRQVVNTFVPYGEAPDRTGDPATVEAMRRIVKPVVSDLFTSLVTKGLVYNISIPIMREGKLRYIMSLGLFPDDAFTLLQDQHLEAGWISTLWDRNGMIVAQSREPERWVGKTVPDRWRLQPKGEVIEDVSLDDRPVLVDSVRSKLSGWTVRMSFPASRVDERIREALLLWAGAAVMIVLLSAVMAYLFGRNFTRPLAAMADAAAALGRGKPVEVSDTRIAEVNVVNQSLRDAHRELEASRIALRSSEQLLGTAADAAQFGAHQYDASNDRVYRSPQIRRILGAEAGDDDDFETALSFVHPEDREQVQARKRQILKSEDRYQLTYRIKRPSGEVRWVMDRGEVERNPSGRALRVIGVLMDITDLKAAEQRQRLLFDELNHRVKNTLAVVQSLAQQTLRSRPEPEDFTRAFSERLQSLSRAHDLLVETAWQGASLQRIVGAVLEPFAAQSDRISIEGPPIELPATITIALALMLNELATNAAKYGALSGPSGDVRISWTIVPEGQMQMIDLTWREANGPAIVPPRHRGFGSRLLAASAQQIRGDFDIAFAPEGVVCRIRFAAPKPAPSTAWVG